MKTRGLLLLFILSISLISLASAEISFSQPRSLYNLGDYFNISISILENTDTGSFFISRLVCDSSFILSNSTNSTEISSNPDSSVEIYRTPISVKSGEKKIVQIETKLDPYLVSSAEGTCKIESEYNSQIAKSQPFTLSRSVDLSSSIDKSQLDPEDEFEISGIATKENGQPLNGYIELRIDPLGINIVEPTTDGSFKINLVVPESGVPGYHPLEIKAYEKDESGNILNSGVSTQNILVREIVTSLDIALNTPSINPGEELVYTVSVLDQSGRAIERDVSLTLSSEKNKIEESLSKSGSSNSYSLPLSSPPGSYKVSASVEGIKKERTFLVNELEKLSYSLDNNTLILTNIGNVDFKKPIEISIGDSKKLEDLDLEIGESKKLVLSAPSGEYPITVNDGSENKALGTTLLTGNAISITDGSGNLNFSAIKLLIWILVILILAAVAILAYRKIAKKKDIIKKPSFFSRPKSMNKINNHPEVEKKTTNENESLDHTSLISHGHKQDCTIISLKINNNSEAESSPKAKDTIEKVLHMFKDAKAKIYLSKDYRIIILAPIITGTDQNAVLAAKLAAEAKNMLDRHNRLHLQNKIEYGLGLNHGKLIVEKEGDKFRFTSADTTVSQAKSISEKSHREVLMTESMHKATVGKVRSTKEANKVWKLSSSRSKYPYKEFIDKFEGKN